ncbi:hypothetical protein AAC387_Pa04g1872 [Persea americana]
MQRWQLCPRRWWPLPRFRFQKFGLKAGNKKHPSALSLLNEGRLVHLSPVQGSGAKGVHLWTLLPQLASPFQLAFFHFISSLTHLGPSHLNLSVEPNLPFSAPIVVDS